MQSQPAEETAAILHAVLALGRRLRAERPPQSVTLSALSILGTLNRLGPIPATRLAAEERLQPQSLTRIVATLEKDRLIVRTRSESDRREITIAITKPGERVLTSDLRSRRAWLERAITSALKERERSLLFAASEVMLKLAYTDSE
ncbi:MAG TPA: MarR family transcriptional regulator [Chthoniobacterales bacterium]|jgi:DNA-binding MarR family transcriptional regulator|nr:MarR family transcriptional regulator [Chthoniobacterales bacterium]